MGNSYNFSEYSKICLYDIIVNYDDVLLVDVMNHMRRFLYVHRDLSIADGDNVIQTGHLYGMLSFLLSLRDRFPNCSIVLCLDGYDHSRRNINPNYKSNRTHTDNSYEVIPDLLRFSYLIKGVYSSYNSLYEADDTIYSVSKFISYMCRRKNIKKNIYVLSNDKDMFQMVSDDSLVPIHIIRKFGVGSNWWNNADVVDVSVVKSTFNGVSPENLVKFRAIVGDSSDNLKGYYRFKKADAAIIAENYDYALGRLTLKKDRVFNPKWNRFLPRVCSDMGVFSMNYAVMKLKDYSFEIGRDSVDDVDSVVDRLKYYQLNKFIQRICSGNYSSYHSKVFESLSRFS